MCDIASNYLCTPASRYIKHSESPFSRSLQQTNGTYVNVGPSYFPSIRQKIICFRQRLRRRTSDDVAICDACRPPAHHRRQRPPIAVFRVQIAVPPLFSSPLAIARHMRHVYRSFTLEFSVDVIRSHLIIILLLSLSPQCLKFILRTRKKSLDSIYQFFMAANDFVSMTYRL